MVTYEPRNCRGEPIGAGILNTYRVAFGLASEYMAGYSNSFRSMGCFRILGALPFEYNDDRLS